MAVNQSRCSKCNSLILSHAKFCGYCGEPAGVRCPECDVLNPTDGRYCYDCGQRLHPPPWELGRVRPNYAQRDHTPTPALPPSTAGVVTCQRCNTTNEPGATFCYQCGLPIDTESGFETTPLTQARDAQSYRSSRMRANWAIALAAAVCLVSMLYMWVLDKQLDAVTVQGGNHSAALEAEEDVAVVATLFLFAYVASAVAFLMWVHRVSRNLRSLGSLNQRFTPSWAVGLWFIPIVNFFLPYQVVAEIWRGSTATIRETWGKPPVPVVMGVWWGLHLVGSLLPLIGLKLQDELPTTRGSILLDMFGTAATIIAGGILIYLVKQITDSQESKSRRVSIQDPTPGSGPGLGERYSDTGTPTFRWHWPSKGALRKFIYLLVAVAVVVVVFNLLSSADSEESVSIADPVTPPELRYIEEKRYMLELINEERRREGLVPVVLGSNVAAQLHAEASIEECFVSHWGLDGLKPYMRYSLAGGYQSNVENASGSAYCPSGFAFYAPIFDIRQEIRETMDGWMDSPGHREAIMDPWARKVNIGIEWGTYNFSAVQQFEGDYVEYTEMPAIVGDVLTVAGRVKNGVSIATDESLVVAIYYDPLPRRLTRGQTARTYCYDGGTPVAVLREPPPKGSYYLDDETDETLEFCPDPRDVSPEAPPPKSDDEAHELWQEARRASMRGIERTVPIMHITASRWVSEGSAFSVRANIVVATNRYGPGVYTIAILTESGGEDVLVSLYSIFHEIRPPG